jgi:raffinose/stachyose/melibiose transport system permease protein
MNQKNLKSKIYPTYFAFGALALYLLLYVIPSLAGVVLSFTDWNQYRDISTLTFVGLKNYRTIFSPTENYLKFISNTFMFTIMTTIFKTIFGLGLALLLDSQIKKRNWHRALAFFPSIISMIVIGLTFRSILNPQYGILNNFLRGIGLGALAQAWLGDLKWVFPSVMAVDVWKGMGYIMTILLAGLQLIPKEYYESSAIDGATSWRKFQHITFPLLLPTIMVTTVLNVLYGLRVFDIIYVLTKGGPGNATAVVFTEVFDRFGWGDYAVGTTLSTVMLIFTATVGFFMVKILNPKEVEL